MYIGKRIRKIREQQGLTRKQLAHGIVSYSYLSNIENGITQGSPEILSLLAERLQIPPFYLNSQTQIKELNFDIQKAVDAIKQQNIFTAKKLVINIEKDYKFIPNFKQEICYLIIKVFILFRELKYVRAINLFRNELSLLCSEDDIRLLNQDIQHLYNLLKVFTFLKQRNFNQGLYYIKKSLVLGCSDIQKAELFFYLAYCYRGNHQYLGAINQARKSLLKFKELDSFKTQYHCLNLLGTLYWDTKRTEASELLLLESRNMAKRDENIFFLTYNYVNLSLIYAAKQRQDLSCKLIKDVVEIRENLKQGDLSNPYILIIEMLIKSGRDLSEAEYYIDKLQAMEYDGRTSLMLQLLIAKMELKKGKEKAYEEQVSHLLSTISDEQYFYDITSFMLEFGKHLKRKKRYKDACFHIEQALKYTTSGVGSSEQNFLGKTEVPFSPFI